MWNWLLILSAGPYAQAYSSRRSLTRKVLNSWKLDLEEATPAIGWLVRHGYARDRKETLSHVHQESVIFLLLHWDAVARVAARLLKDRRLSARQVRRLAQL